MGVRHTTTRPQTIDRQTHSMSADPTHERRLSLARAQRLASMLAALAENARVGVGPGSFCAACEAVFPMADPVMFVRNRDRVVWRHPDEPALGNALRGMLAELEALTAGAPRCARRLRDRYDDPRLMPYMMERIRNAVVEVAWREDLAAMALPHLFSRYGRLASDVLSDRYDISGWCDRIRSPDLAFAVLTAVRLNPPIVDGMLLHSVQRRDGVFARCCRYIDECRGPLDAPWQALVYALHGNPESAQNCAVAATMSRDEGALRALLRFTEDPDPDLQRCAALATSKPLRIAILSTNIYRIDELEKVVDFDAEWIVGLLADPRMVKPHEMYTCAAACMMNGTYNMARAIVTRLRDWGGVREVGGMSPSDRRNALYNMTCATGGYTLEHCAAELACLIHGILSQLKVPLETEERKLLSKVSPGVRMEDGSVWGEGSGDASVGTAHVDETLYDGYESAPPRKRGRFNV